MKIAVGLILGGTVGWAINGPSTALLFALTFAYLAAHIG